MKIINQIISVCSMKDSEVWRVSSRAVLRYIDASKYVVIVPDEEVDYFKTISPPKYEVLSEKLFVSDLKARLTKIFSPKIQDRIGWYLQQFIKISAILRNEDNEIVLIWDADTVPLKHINFINSDGKLIFYTGTEHRKSYFDFLSKSLHLSKAVNYSFIAQCLPVKVYWVRNMCKDFAGGNWSEWVDGVLSQLDVNEPAGFSEYESIGTYVSHHYRNEFELSHKKWYRNGMKLVGDPSTLSRYTFLGLAKHYDYISFEGWDRVRGFRSLLKIKIRRIKYCLMGAVFNPRIL